jgi:hypothetical protein
MFSILDPVSTMEALDPVEKLTYCELFKSLASEFVSPDNKIRSSNEDVKEARDFATSVVWHTGY